jgi:mRNA interferase YafQ
MKIITHKNFDKQFAKLRKKEQDCVKESIRLFLADENNPKLRNHKLKGDWLGYSSISAGGDLRIHYKILEDGLILFCATLGKHSELY